MKAIQVSRVLPASREDVFKAVAEPKTSAEIVPCIKSNEILEGSPGTVGLRFRETRAMGKREMTMEFEVTECDAPHHLRVVCDDHGTIWDSAFDLAERAGGTELTITMDARAHSLLPKLLNPVMKPLFRRGLVQHLDALEAHFAQNQPES